eukprot:3062340-Pyramimonas_sp.AAC.1
MFFHQRPAAPCPSESAMRFKTTLAQLQCGLSPKPSAPPPPPHPPPPRHHHHHPPLPPPPPPPWEGPANPCIHCVRGRGGGLHPLWTLGSGPPLCVDYGGHRTPELPSRTTSPPGKSLRSWAASEAAARKNGDPRAIVEHISQGVLSRAVGDANASNSWLKTAPLRNGTIPQA